MLDRIDCPRCDKPWIIHDCVVSIIQNKNMKIQANGLIELQFAQGLIETYPHLTEKQINKILKDCRERDEYIYGE